jgi:hypothetical protein
MTDILSKAIAFILALILMVAAPLTIYTFAEDAKAKRIVMNETLNMIDGVIDTGSLPDSVLSDFYLAASSQGLLVDVIVTRYLKVVVPDGSGGTYSTYVIADNIKKYNKGDTIQVRVYALGYTGTQRILQQIMGVVTDKIDFTLSGVVR